MKVYKAIENVMRDLGSEGIGKNKQNKMQNYAFRGIDDVLNALNPILSKHGLIICPRVLTRETVERQTKSGGALFYTFVHAEFDFICSEDGSKHTASTMGEGMDSSDKSTNKAMSAAYKYAAFQTFCIPTEAVDSEIESHEVAPVVKQVKQKEITKPTPSMLLGLFGDLEKSGRSKQRMKDYMVNSLGVPSTDKLTMEQFNKLAEWIKGDELPDFEVPKK